MRSRSILSLVAILAMPFAFTGCGDESTSSNENALSANERQALGQLSSTVPSYKGMADVYLEMAQSMATSFASGFAPSAKRSAVATCNLNKTIEDEGATYELTVTKADGKTPLTTCEEANAAYTSADGIGIKMKMTTSREGMEVVMNFKVIYKPEGTAGGYSAAMNIDASITTNANGQKMTIGIGPIDISVKAATATATPVIDGRMTFTIAPFTVEKVTFDGNGLKAQSASITKNGAEVAKLVVDANGQAVVKDLDGNVIQG